MGQRVVLSDESLIMLHICPIKHGCSLKPARFDWFLVGDGPYEHGTLVSHPYFKWKNMS